MVHLSLFIALKSNFTFLMIVILGNHKIKKRWRKEIEEIDNREKAGEDIDDIPSYPSGRGNWRAGKSLRVQRDVLKKEMSESAFRAPLDAAAQCFSAARPRLPRPP